MRILIIGGTRFLGLEMAREAIARGHEVELFHRSSDVPAGTESAKHLIGDRTRDFTALQTGEWDAVLDVCGYRPHEVNALADVFKGRIGTYAFVSTVSVYDTAIAPLSGEDAAYVSTKALNGVDPITVEMGPTVYGPLKVLCEEAVRVNYGDDNFIIRPTYVFGKEDYTNRFNRWLERIAAGGTVVAPEPREAPIQYIDVQDLAAFTILGIESGLKGPFHVANPSGGMAYGEMLETAREVVGSDCKFDWLPVAEAATQADQFPLWGGGRSNGVMTLDTSKAVGAGLVTRPLAQTVREIRA